MNALPPANPSFVPLQAEESRPVVFRLVFKQVFMQNMNERAASSKPQSHWLIQSRSIAGRPDHNDEVVFRQVFR